MKYAFVENNDILFGINAILNQPFTIEFESRSWRCVLDTT